MTGSMRLDELLSGIAPAPQVAIAGLTLDSRAVGAGDAFVALQGGCGHGLEHAAEAAARGARAILWDPAEGRDPGAADLARPVAEHCCVGGANSGPTEHRRGLAVLLSPPRLELMLNGVGMPRSFVVGTSGKRKGDELLAQLPQMA